MGDWQSHYAWFSCPTPAIAAAVARRLDSVESHRWLDPTRWAVRYGRVGRGALYQVEVIKGYLDGWILDAAPGAIRLEGLDFAIPEDGVEVALEVAADLLGGAVAPLGATRALCLRDTIVPDHDQLVWPDLGATVRSRAPLARVLEALVLATRAPRATFAIGRRLAAHGCVCTGTLTIEVRDGGAAWGGGEAAIEIDGATNHLNGGHARGPSVWALPAAATAPPLADDRWPFP